MGLFSKRSTPEPAETSGDREAREAREAIVKDLARRVRSADSSTAARADEVRALPGGEQMVTEAVRRAARG